MLADEVQYVIGVDTHRDAHAVAVVAAATGGLCHQAEVPACAGGDQDALALAGRHAPGARVWAVEGTGAYGSGLARVLAAQGERVVEVDRPQRRGERTRAKSDALDALRAARSVLGREHAAIPRSGVGARRPFGCSWWPAPARSLPVPTACASCVRLSSRSPRACASACAG